MLIESGPSKTEEAIFQTPRIELAQSALHSYHAMSHIVEHLAEGVGTLLEFAEEESGI